MRPGDDRTGMGVKRRDADFDADGTRCAAWLYLPTLPDEPPPVAVLAHGLAGRRDWRLPEIAERFGRHGVAALVFDYRGFGDSDGDPRRVVSPSRQRTDLRAALDHARSLDAVDGTRVALWGTGFGAGHALSLAAADGDVDAVVAQVPFSDGRRTALHLVRAGGLSYLKNALGAGLRDAVGGRLGREPTYVPVVGDAGEFGALPIPGASDGDEALADDHSGEAETTIAARSLLAVPRYRPVTDAPAIDCPVFVAQAAADRTLPDGTVDALVAALDDVERVRYPTDHVGVFREAFDAVADREASFLARHLL